MRPPFLPLARRWGGVPCVAAVTIMVLASFAATGSGRSSTASGAPVPDTVLSAVPSLASIEAAGYAPVRDAASDAVRAGSMPLAGTAPGSLEVIVAFAHSNQSRLDAELSAISDPSSPSYHQYLSRATFDAEFGAPASTYRAAAEYLASFGVSDLTTYPDRGSISFVTSPAVADRIFGTTVSSFEDQGHRYFAPTAPIHLPRTIAPSVTEVLGLGTASALTAAPGTWGAPSRAGPGPAAERVRVGASTYLVPPTDHGVQLEYGPDLQIAYDEESLFAQYGYPTNATIAFLTVAGNYTGAAVATPCGNLTPLETLGGWDPSDVSAFFNATLPAGEPDPMVVPVPIGGAPSANCSASWDSSGVAAANTVDLEMIGSTAPGATIYGIYGVQPTVVELDSAFAQALTYPKLNVVVTPWGFNDTNDSTWYSYLQEAQGLGVTVMAATGDSGGDLHSPAWVGSVAEFPSSVASAAAVGPLGVIAVGGTTLTLSRSTLQIASEVAWNVSETNLSLGRGSTGGTSLKFLEPAWQKNTSANAVIGGKYRGVPDIAALANNTVATVSVDGNRLEAQNASRTNATSNASVNATFFLANGTGIAASLAAGVVAEMDHALLSAQDPALGFFDPSLYSLASMEYGPLPNSPVHFSSPTSLDYVSPLPTLPFHDVTQGRDFVSVAGTGYDLVTGWGSLDAYNYTMYVLSPPHLPAYGPLRGLQDRVRLTGLHVNTTRSDGSWLVEGLSIQQNLFLANSFGAPVYWVQSVLYIQADTPGVWEFNFTGWVVYPPWPLYPNLSVYEAWYPTSGHLESLPLTLNLTTYLTPEPTPRGTVIGFSFGAGLPTFALPVPGAEYMMGGYDHNYSWQGVNYTNGPWGPNGSERGFLAPQFGLYAFPGGKNGTFTRGTSGTVAAYVEPFGTTSFVPAQAFPVTLANTQTYEQAVNLAFTSSSSYQWTFGYQLGSTDQGIATAEPYRYPVTFVQTGVPASATWSVDLSDGATASGTGTNGSLVIPMENGTYTWTTGISVRNYTASPSGGPLVVTGNATTIGLSYSLSVNTVMFSASGPEFPFPWSVKIAGGPNLSGSGFTLSAALIFAKYSYRVTCADPNWSATHRTGAFTIGASAVEIAVTFAHVTFAVHISPTASVSEVNTARQNNGGRFNWTVTVAGIVKKGAAVAPFTFELPNGTYSFNISGLDPGYRAVPSSGTFTVNGTMASAIVIQILGPAGPWGPFGLGIYGYILVGGIVAAALAAFWFWRRRRFAPKTAPEEPPDKEPPSGGRYIPPDSI